MTKIANDVTPYEVEYKDREYKTTPGDVLVNIYKYIRDIADTHSSGRV